MRVLSLKGKNGFNDRRGRAGRKGHAAKKGEKEKEAGRHGERERGLATTWRFALSEKRRRTSAGMFLQSKRGVTNLDPV